MSGFRRRSAMLIGLSMLWATAFVVASAGWLAYSQVPDFWQVALLAVIASGFLLAAGVGWLLWQRVRLPRSRQHKESGDIANLVHEYPELLSVDLILPSRGRTKVLSLASKNSVGAELGVFTGKFSREIYKTVQPRKFYLVDPWHTRFGTRYPDWGVYTAGGRLRTEAALRATKLRAGMMHGAAEVVVSGALEWLASLPEGSLDWVYLDTTHSYEDTIAELHAIARVLTEDGVIMGDDYQIDPAHRHHGLFRAVRDFSRLGQFEIIWMDGDKQWAMRRSRT